MQWHRIPTTIGYAPYYNLERSHIAHPFRKGLIFEAQLAPQIVVAQGVRRLFAAGTVAHDTKPHWAFSFSVSPMVRLRMVNTASQPVRTPSYMPHAVLQVFRVRNLGNDTAKESELRRGPYEMWTGQVRLSHHSNGEDGCLYTSQVKKPKPDGSFQCEFPPGHAPDPSTLNLLDGSFSKNFVRAGLFYRRMYLPEGVNDTINHSWYLGATVETHKCCLVNWMPGTIPDDQAQLYGTWRWRLTGGGSIRQTGRFAGGHFLDVTYERYPNAAEVLTPWSFSVEYAWSLNRFSGWGLYARYFKGQDYYNLGFGRQPLNRFSVGLAWVQERFETIGLS